MRSILHPSRVRGTGWSRFRQDGCHHEDDERKDQWSESREGHDHQPTYPQSVLGVDRFADRQISIAMRFEPTQWGAQLGAVMTFEESKGNPARAARAVKTIAALAASRATKEVAQ